MVPEVIITHFRIYVIKIFPEVFCPVRQEPLPEIPGIFWLQGTFRLDSSYREAKTSFSLIIQGKVILVFVTGKIAASTVDFCFLILDAFIWKAQN